MWFASATETVTSVTTHSFIYGFTMMVEEPQTAAAADLRWAIVENNAPKPNSM
jgi:hypothetical protein